MLRQFSVAGVPASIVLDGWWLDAATEGAGRGGRPGAPASASGGSRRVRGNGLRLLLVAGLADLLFWRQTPGLSMALFAAGIFLVACADVRPRKVLLRPAALLAAGAAPVVELAQPLSIAFLVAGLSAAIVLCRAPGADAGQVGAAALHLAGRLPLGGLRALVAWLRTLDLRSQAGAGPDNAVLRGALRDWGFPVAGLAAFGTLLAEANPLLSRALTQDLDVPSLMLRGAFWIGVGLLAWPLLDRAAPTPAHAPRPSWRMPQLGINARSTLRALWVFNLLIGVQNVLDLAILTGGAALPDGMSHASYAHRGAYPLLATALLAGAFALAARPYLDTRRSLRPLLHLWLAQNLLLCLSAALRLDFYVAAYGLTYLRLHAFVWMGLVAGGLALTAWQIGRGLPNRWLLLRAAMLGIGTLYACAFVNFAAIIATHNLTRAEPDRDYLCALGPTAAAALAASPRPLPCTIDAPRIEGWRDWGFRNWRVSLYLQPTLTGERGE